MEYKHIMNTFARRPLRFVRGEGVYLYDAQGHSYLDALAGIAVCGLGHAPRELAEVMHEQAMRLVHTSNGYIIGEQHLLAETLCTLTGMDKVFFANSGTEANEAALKLSRLHARQKGVDEPLVLIMEHAFHGRTFGAMSATPNPKIQKGYQPLLPGFAVVPFNDLAALEAYAKDSRVVAVMLEVVQGEGGVYPSDAAYVRGVRALCDRHNWLMIVDEIQAGMGRTGRWCAYQHADVLPDVVTMAKGLGNGFPIGVCLARGATAELFTPGSHGSTFGGNPLACAVAQRVLEIYQREHLPEHAEEMGAYLLRCLQERFADHPQVEAIRGMGMMLGVVLRQADAEVAARGEAQGLIFNVTAERVIRLLPPLIYQRQHVDELVDKLAKTLAVSPSI